MIRMLRRRGRRRSFNSKPGSNLAPPGHRWEESAFPKSGHSEWGKRTLPAQRPVCARKLPKVNVDSDGGSSPQAVIPTSKKRRGASIFVVDLRQQPRADTHPPGLHRASFCFGHLPYRQLLSFKTTVANIRVTVWAGSARKNGKSSVTLSVSNIAERQPVKPLLSENWRVRRCDSSIETSPRNGVR